MVAYMVHYLGGAAVTARQSEALLYESRRCGGGAAVTDRQSECYKSRRCSAALRSGFYMVAADTLSSVAAIAIAPHAAVLMATGGHCMRSISIKDINIACVQC
jgi:hypothetical protein